MLLWLVHKLNNIRGPLLRNCGGDTLFLLCQSSAWSAAAWALVPAGPGDTEGGAAGSSPLLCEVARLERNGPIEIVLASGPCTPGTDCNVAGFLRGSELTEILAERSLDLPRPLLLALRAFAWALLPRCAQTEKP